jgi:hypothetical protein
MSTTRRPASCISVFISIALHFFPTAGVPFGTICMPGWFCSSRVFFERSRRVSHLVPSSLPPVHTSPGHLLHHLGRQRRFWVLVPTSLSIYGGCILLHHVVVVFTTRRFVGTIIYLVSFSFILSYLASEQAHVVARVFLFILQSVSERWISFVYRRRDWHERTMMYLLRHCI